MSARTTTSTRPHDRLSFLWLVLAAVGSLLYAGQWTAPLAAWLAPVFLLRFVRTQRPCVGLPTA